MWKKISFDDRYEVSDDGYVRKANSGKVLHQYEDRYGYLYTSIKSKKFKIHRLVAEAFIGDISGEEIDHIDTDRKNNNVSNLRIVSRKENANNPLTVEKLKKHSGKYAILYGRSIIRRDGTCYRSIIDAHRATGVSRSAIQYHLKNKTGEWNYA